MGNDVACFAYHFVLSRASSFCLPRIRKHTITSAAGFSPFYSFTIAGLVLTALLQMSSVSVLYSCSLTYIPLQALIRPVFQSPICHLVHSFLPVMIKMRMQCPRKRTSQFQKSFCWGRNANGGAIPICLS